jgi:phosphatidylinositol-4,5-bisphosphate 3-kinase catalytic subunit alpha/beta/delta
VLTPEYAYVMGGKGSDHWNRFVELACDAYVVARRKADLFISLFAMMMSTGIPELTSEKDIQWLREAFALDLSVEDARKRFEDLIYVSLDTKTTQINFLVHNLAH